MIGCSGIDLQNRVPAGGFLTDEISAVVYRTLPHILVAIIHCGLRKFLLEVFLFFLWGHKQINNNDLS
jgi:hypothetical protein